MWPWPWRQPSFFFFSFFAEHSGLWWCVIRPSLVVKESTVQKKKNNKKRHILILWALAVTWPCKWHKHSFSFCMTLWLIILHHHSNFFFFFKWFRKYHLDKHSLTFWTFAVTLALNAVISFFHKTLRLMMLYYLTNFGCKPTSSLEDTTVKVIFWL